MANFKKLVEDDAKEHLAVLIAAKTELKNSEEARKVGIQRLENALKRYKERSENGPSRHL